MTFDWKTILAFPNIRRIVGEYLPSNSSIKLFHQTLPSNSSIKLFHQTLPSILAFPNIRENTGNFDWKTLWAFKKNKTTQTTWIHWSLNFIPKPSGMALGRVCGALNPWPRYPTSGLKKTLNKPLGRRYTKWGEILPLAGSKELIFAFF